MRVVKFFTIGIIAFLFLSFHLNNEGKNFYVIFGSGFRNDTIKLEINDRQIMDNMVLQSDTITGISNASVHLKNDTLILLDRNSKVLNSIPFKYSDQLKIIITINGLPYDLRANMKKGKYIVISKHWYYYNVYLNQYRKPVSFE